jgi:hypothetical protein
MDRIDDPSRALDGPSFIFVNRRYEGREVDWHFLSHILQGGGVACVDLIR